MNKLALSSLFLIISTASSFVVADQYNSSGGFLGPGYAQMPTTVAAARDTSFFSDDVPVVLTGVLVQSLGNEMYTFRDATGEISVEIDHDDWYGLQVDPNTIVILDGEVDKEIYGTTIDVQRIRTK